MYEYKKIYILTWNPNDLYVWRSTPQNKAEIPIKTRGSWAPGIYIWYVFFLCKQIGGFKVVVNIPSETPSDFPKHPRNPQPEISLPRGRLRRWRFLWIMGKSRPGIIQRGPPIRTESWHGKINQAPKDWQVLSCPLVMFRVSTSISLGKFLRWWIGKNPG